MLTSCSCWCAAAGASNLKCAQWQGPLGCRDMTGQSARLRRPARISAYTYVRLALKSNCLHTASGIESGTPLELRKQRAPLLAQRLGRRRCRGRFRALRRLPTFASLLCGPPPLASLEERKDTQASMLRLEQAALCEMACTVRLPLHEAHSSRRLARATPRQATSLVVANDGQPRLE